MTTAYTSLLGLALPVTGELQGTWGDTVNNSITSLLDTAISGTTTLSTDGDVTLTTTTGAANQARQAILLCSGARTAQRTITAPAQSKIYTVINNTSGGYAVKLVGVGPTTGVTIPAGTTAQVAWNGSDFVDVSGYVNGNLTVNGTLTVNGVTTLKNNLLFSADNTYDIGASGATRPRNLYLAGDEVVGGSVTLSAGTVNGLAYLNASKVVTTSGDLTYSGTVLQISSNAADGADLYLTKANSGTANQNGQSLNFYNYGPSNNSRVAGTVIGQLYFGASQPTSGAIQDAAAIKVLAESQTSTNTPSSLAFFTNATSTGNAEAGRFTSGKSFLLNTTTGSAFTYGSGNYATVNMTVGAQGTGPSVIQFGQWAPAGGAGVNYSAGANKNWFVIGYTSFQYGQVSEIEIIGDTQFGAIPLSKTVLVIGSNNGSTVSGYWYGITANGSTINSVAYDSSTGAIYVKPSQDFSRFNVHVKGSQSILVSIVDTGSTSTPAGATVITNSQFAVTTSGTQRWIVDSSGNTAIGNSMTPSAWPAGYNAIQFGNSTTRASSIFTNGVDDTWYASNAYYNGSSWVKYASGTSAGYEQAGGQHYFWYNATSGTGTFAYTLAQIITSAGNVGINTNSPNVSGQGSNQKVLTVQGGPTQSSSFGGIEIGNIYSGAGQLIGFLGFTSTGQDQNYKMPTYIGSWFETGTTNRIGANLRFHTQPDNTAGALERMRIAAAGPIGMGITNPEAYSLGGNTAGLVVNGPIYSATVVQGHITNVGYLPTTAGNNSPFYAKLGTFTCGQGGYVCHLRVYAHQGYNASNSQNAIYDVFFKTSNGGSSISGSTGAFYGDGQVFRLGPNSSFSFYVSQTNTSSYDIWASLGTFSENMFYTVDVSQGCDWIASTTWNQTGPTGNYVTLQANVITYT